MTMCFRLPEQGLQETSRATPLMRAWLHKYGGCYISSLPKVQVKATECDGGKRSQPEANLIHWNMTFCIPLFAFFGTVGKCTSPCPPCRCSTQWKGCV